MEDRHEAKRQSAMSDRFVAPFKVKKNEDAFWVEDSQGARFAFTYYRNRPLVGTDHSGRLSSVMAERTVKWIARMATAQAAKRSSPAAAQASVSPAVAAYEAKHPEAPRGESYPTGFAGRKARR